MTAPDQNDIQRLRARLERFPAERFPVQHATGLYQLASILAEQEQYAEAAGAFRHAAELYGDQLPLEHAKCLNGLGSALRARGQLREAAQVFESSASAFDAVGRPIEQGAALFNLGLVERERGNLEAAVEAFRTAEALLDPRRVPFQTAAVLRELGTTRFLSGSPREAILLLERGLDTAEDAGDTLGAGAAANILGLAYLAEGQTAEAAASFRVSVGANPKTLRPEAYSMAKANLALACEQLGDGPEARLAALQAADCPGVPVPVRDQANSTLARVGRAPGALLEVLASRNVEQWVGVFRDEVARWVDLSEERRGDEVRALVEGQVARSHVAVEMAEAWLGALLELPSEAMDLVVRMVLEATEALEEGERDTFRHRTRSAMVRFREPQWMRLGATFNRIAEELGQEPALW